MVHDVKEKVLSKPLNIASVESKRLRNAGILKETDDRWTRTLLPTYQYQHRIQVE